MCTTIRRTSLSVLALCLCTACASAGGGAGQPGTRIEQNARFEQNPRFVEVTTERPGDFVFYLPGDSVGDRPSRGLYRVPLAETGILPSYELPWWPRP
jgi:hypothetical protein